MLICITCRCTVTFTDDGWAHTDPATECPNLVIAWPPAIVGEER